MPPRGSANGWERWRGQVDERLDNLVASVTRIEASMSSLPMLKAKIAVASGIGGILLAAGVNVALRWLVGV